MCLIVTQDETWVLHFDPEANKQSKQWKHPGSPAPKKFKRVSSAGKAMALSFRIVRALSWWIILRKAA